MRISRMECPWEDINKLKCGQDMEDTDITDSDTLVNKVEVDRHMLHMLVLHGIGGEVDHAVVVAVDEVDAREGVWRLYNS